MAWLLSNGRQLRDVSVARLMPKMKWNTDTTQREAFISKLNEFTGRKRHNGSFEFDAISRNYIDASVQ